MKIYSWNVNGLRAVHRKGALEEFLKTKKPDVLMLQEIKGKEEQFEEIISASDYIKEFNSAEKPGYSGVSIWVKPEYKVEFKKGMPKWKDGEGRILKADIGKLSLITVYVPNGGKSEEAYADKLKFYKLLAAYSKDLQAKGQSVLIGGDFNVARSELDLAEPEKHRKHTHFNDEVRKHMEMIIESNMVDTYRSRNPKKEGAYTYWDNFDFALPRGTKPREINKGWRIDFFLADKKLDKKIKKVEISNKVMGSDHCPILVELD